MQNVEVGFSNLSPGPIGSWNFEFLTSDSDSSSKTLYIASWTGLESGILDKKSIKFSQINTNSKCFFLFERRVIKIIALRLLPYIALL